MTVPMQCVKVRWNGKTQQHYLDRGHVYTGLNKTFWVEVEDLPKNSGAMITIVCDYCEEYFTRRYADYTKRLDMSLIDKDSCLKKECINSKKVEGHQLTYGVKYSAQREEVQEKTRETHMKKYGVEYFFQAEGFQDLVKEASLKNFGVEHHTQSEIVINRRRETSLKRYGHINAGQSKEARRKIAKTYEKNGTTSTSSQQLKVFQMLEDVGYTVTLNKAVSIFNLDIALHIEDVKIAVEYDGWYWHQDPQKDKNRDIAIEELGWKTLRIKSGRKIPDIEVLNECIEKLKKSDLFYQEIVLEDWRNPPA